MSELNKKGIVCVTALWMMPLAFGASITSFLLGVPKAMYIWLGVFWLSFTVCFILWPQKYVGPKDKLLKKH